MVRLALAALLPLIAAPAWASSNEAWDQLTRQAQLRCIQASHFRDAHASQPIVFSDDSAQVAVLVNGTFPQRAMNGKTGANLCLFNRRTGITQVQEAMGWRAPR